jgi:peptidoglycan/xylan/chitin deacetylase (PgdA/CDA1 family)
VKPRTVIVKKCFARLLSVSRLFGALKSFRLREKAFVLMYHRTLSPDDVYRSFLQPGMYVTTASFERQIAFLKGRYRLLSLEGLVRKIEKGEDVGGCCSITFDDGWGDNYSNAFPILKKYEVPATIFLATSFIGTDRLFWSEELAGCFPGKPLAGEELGKVYASVGKLWRQMGEFKSESRESQLNRAIEILKWYTSAEREAVLDFFRKKGLPRNPRRQMMTWDEAKVMAASGLVSFGAHSVGHELLDQMPSAEARREILQSREDIRRHLGVTVASFAYPNGNYNDIIIDVLRDIGFTSAVTTRKGFFSRHTPLFEIPRIGIHEDISDTVPMLQARILLEWF